MFIGYHIKQNETQAKPMTLATDIKLSQAVLEPGTKNKEPVCLFVEYDKKKFIVAVLDPSKTWQAPLDLMFAAGSEVKFFIRGSGTVHLTGFESYDDLDDMSLSMSSDEEIEEDDDQGEEEEEELEPAKKKLMVKQGTAKKVAKVNGVAKPVQKNGKAPIVGVKGDEADDDSDDSDDDDFDEDAFEEDDDDDDDLDDEDDEEMDDLDEDDDDEDESEE